MLIDSHCHLPVDAKAAEEIVKRAQDADVTKLINVGTSVDDSKKAIETAEKFDGVFATVGVYPHEDQDKTIEKIRSELEKLLPNQKIVGVGECGIDLANRPDERPLQQQIELFEMQIELALKNKLPIIIHNRNGNDHVLKILEKYQDKGLTGVAHTFDGTWEFAKKLLDLNLYLSFSGFITYKSKRQLLETVEKVPVEKFLVETDSPYIAPKGLRDKQNEPKNVKIIAEKISEVKSLPKNDTFNYASGNTCALFRI